VKALSRDVANWWEQVPEKPVVLTLGAAAVTLVYVATRVLEVLDRLPLVGGVLELTGFLYSGWFIYTNLLYR
jgi:hypothetical protein